MARKNPFRYLVALLAIAVLLTACGSKSVEPAPPGSTGAAAVGGELITPIPSDPDTFSALWGTNSSYTSRIKSRIYGGGLLRIGFDNLPEPNLAKTMPTVSADQRTFTFTLRKGVMFNDGVEVRAKDIKLTYDIMMHPDFDGINTTIRRTVQSVTAPDDWTLVFTMKDVDASFMYSIPYQAPIPFHIFGNLPVKDLGQSDLWKNPVGAGPYTLKEFLPGQHTVLVRRSDYWEYNTVGINGQLNGPHLEQIRFKVIPENATSVAAMEAGELNFYESFPPGETIRFKTAASITARMTSHNWDRMGFGYQTFNTDLWPTSDKAVRQALSYGLNKPAIITGLLDGLASLPAGVLPPVHPFYDSNINGYNFDRARAAKILADAGYTKNAAGKLTKDGQQVKIKYTATAGHPLIDGIILQSQKDWGELGIDMEIVTVDFNTLLSRHMETGDFHVTFSGLSLGLDPSGTFDSFSSEEIRTDAAGINKGANKSKWSSPAVDALLVKGRATTDLEARKKIYQQAEQLIMDEAVWNMLYVNKYADFITNDFQGVLNQKGGGLLGLTNYLYTVTAK